MRSLCCNFAFCVQLIAATGGSRVRFEYPLDCRIHGPLGTKSPTTLINDSFEAISMGGQMPTRKTRFLPAIAAICLAAVCLTAQASRADDCLSKPNAPSPPGTHWYYHVDRATHRECWYLGAQGAPVRTQVRQAASPVRPPAPKPTAQPIVQPRAQVPAETATTEAAPAEITAVEAGAARNDAAADLSMRWLDVPGSTASLDRAPVPASNSYAEEQPMADSQDDMPLIWPILTAQDLAAAGQSSQSAISFAQLAAPLAAVLGLAALIMRIIFKFAADRTARPNAGDGRRSAAYRDSARRAVKAASDPAAGNEANVRVLLRELQRRRDAPQYRDFHPTSRPAMA
jgi:hypothetical protein